MMGECPGGTNNQPMRTAIFGENEKKLLIWPVLKNHKRGKDNISDYNKQNE